MSKLTKVDCTRCSGSGTYSFNLVRGTVCFKCEGSGFQMIDLAVLARRKIADEKKQVMQAARAGMMKSAWAEVIAEMNAMHGPFDVATALGVDMLNKATFIATGKALVKIRDERILAA